MKHIESISRTKGHSTPRYAADEKSPTLGVDIAVGSIYALAAAIVVIIYTTSISGTDLATSKEKSD